MAINPGVQEKAQREIDRVVGIDRLPDFSDRPTLPYIEAIYREVLRCKPPLHMGMPHCLTEDDHYKDFLIPKGGSFLFPIFLINVYKPLASYRNRRNCAWKYMASFLKPSLSQALTQTIRAMTHDKSVYPEPFAFKPERFFDKNGDLNDDERILAYGFGRRYFLSATVVNLFSQ